MIELATIAVGYSIDVDVAKRDRVANAAFEVAEQAAQKFLSVGDFGVETVVERGSVDVFVTVVVTAQALLAALGAYGSASEGLVRLRADVKAMKRYFVRELSRRAEIPSNALETSRLTTEELSRIAKFIDDVERGKLTPMEGAREACTELERVDTPLDAKTKRQLQESFTSIAPEREERRPARPAGESSDANRALSPPRRRIARKPSRTDHVRIWRNPGESKQNREER